MYAIVATMVKVSEEFPYVSVRQIPTFYLDESVQGIVSEDHAARIARTILDPWGASTEREISISAERI
jgi:hypothetical protein